MARRCPSCGDYLNKTERWTVCPNCGQEIHIKKNKNGRIKKVIPHPPSKFSKSLFYSLKKEV